MPVCLLILVGVQQLWCWYGMVTSFNKPYIYTYASCLLLEAGVRHTPMHDRAGWLVGLVLFERSEVAGRSLWPVGRQSCRPLSRKACDSMAYRIYALFEVQKLLPSLWKSDSMVSPWLSKILTRFFQMAVSVLSLLRLLNPVSSLYYTSYYSA